MTHTIEKNAESIGNIAGTNSFIRQKLLLTEYVPFSAATLWRLVNAGKFPKPVKVTDQITAWRVSDIENWASDPAGYSSNKEVAK